MVCQRGSHIRLQKRTWTDLLKLTVPAHRPVKRSTLSRILKQARLSPEELLDLLWTRAAGGDAPRAADLAKVNESCRTLKIQSFGSEKQQRRAVVGAGSLQYHRGARSIVPEARVADVRIVSDPKVMMDKPVVAGLALAAGAGGF